MKRFYVAAAVLLASLPFLSAEKNKIKMVTYFPVPYVAYSRVNVSEQLDIGLTDACAMKLGCGESPVSLNATQVYLNSGVLELNGGKGILGNTLTLGKGGGIGKIRFSNLRIQTGHMESVNADKIEANTLKLFGKPFPSCKDANSGSNGQMQWQKLRLKGANKEELYLMCGLTAGGSDCKWKYEKDKAACKVGNFRIFCENNQLLDYIKCDGYSGPGIYIKENLKDCPSPSPGEVCFVKEQHSVPWNCELEGNDERERTLFQAKKYTADCHSRE